MASASYQNSAFGGGTALNPDNLSLIHIYASFSDTISHEYYLRKIFDSEAAQLPQQYFTTKTAEIKPFRINKLKAYSSMEMYLS